VLLEAATLLHSLPIEVWLTFSGEEGKYAHRLVTRYGHLPNVRFLGKLTRDQVFERYEMVDCLVFPSLLETWGLPISEFKSTGKPMLLADLPYARETVGTYANVHFFDPHSSRDLALLMRQLSSGVLRASVSVEQVIAPPYAADWRQLFQLMLNPAPDC
jgi:glycosyltransferase involved in cell wall biosynthesis